MNVLHEVSNFTSCTLLPLCPNLPFLWTNLISLLIDRISNQLFVWKILLICFTVRSCSTCILLSTLKWHSLGMLEICCDKVLYNYILLLQPVKYFLKWSDVNETVSNSGCTHVIDQLLSGLQNNILDYLIFCEYSFQKFVVQNAKSRRALPWS